MTLVVRTIAAGTHGRYLVAAPDATPVGVVIGFHGYAESADIHLDALRRIPGADRWLLVAVQALHPFYTRDQRVVASWMTSQDRELAIADNVEYVQRVLEAVRSEHGAGKPRVVVGFSQGGAMAYRAAAHLGADGLVILAADVPPDVAVQPALHLPPTLIGRGTTDGWYTEEKQRADLATLAGRGVEVESCVFEGGHEWGAPFLEAASTHLARLATS